MNRPTEDASECPVTSGEDLGAYLDGELDPARSAEVARHVESCERCRAEAERLRKVGALVAREMPWPHAPATLAGKVAAGMRDDAPSGRPRMVKFRSWRRALTSGLAAAAALTLAAVIGLEVTSHERSPGASPAAPTDGWPAATPAAANRKAGDAALRHEAPITTARNAGAERPIAEGPPYPPPAARSAAPETAATSVVPEDNVEARMLAGFDREPALAGGAGRDVRENGLALRKRAAPEKQKAEGEDKRQAPSLKDVAGAAAPAAPEGVARLREAEGELTLQPFGCGGSPAVPGRLSAGEEAIPADRQAGKEPVRRSRAVASAPAPTLTLDLGDGVTMELAPIPAGEFAMGERGESHRVTISRPFYMGRYEVTQAQYERVMGANPSRFAGADLPVEQVSWDDATEFCRKLSQAVGTQGELPRVPAAFRLPTEAEWEYACRGGATTSYCFGDDENRLGEYAWYSGNSRSKPHPVGGRRSNAWGLHDMHGNVWEWCSDWSGAELSGAVTDPAGPASGSARVVRGGSWLDPPGRCRCPERLAREPDYRDHFLGFRVAVDWQE